MRFYFDVRDKFVIHDEVGRDLTTTISEAVSVRQIPGGRLPLPGIRMPDPRCPFGSLAKATNDSTKRSSSLRQT